MRLCSACKIYKEEKEFNKKGIGYQSQCRACQRAWYKNYYDSSPREKERLLEKNKVLKEQIREKIKSIKESSPCADCNQHFPYYVMDFDHRGDKSFTIANNVYRKSWSTIEQEIDKCEIVCANCHRIRTHQK